jgi:hypothetical protein
MVSKWGVPPLEEIVRKHFQVAVDFDRDFLRPFSVFNREPADRLDFESFVASDSLASNWCKHFSALVLRPNAPLSGAGARSAEASAPTAG